MADMILLQCEKGSKAARVACPQCGRISMQILKAPYTGSVSADFGNGLTCPVCESVSHACSTAQAHQWESALSRFLQNSSAYNSAIKDNYARQQMPASATR